MLFEEITKFGNILLEALDTFSPNEVRKHYSEPLYKMSKSSNQNLMRVIHYPPLRESDHPDEIRAVAHTDINLITLLISGSQPGLQVKDKNKNWVDIKSKKGQIVINTGDMLKECSNGYFPSTVHRVINPEVKKMCLGFLFHYFFTQGEMLFYQKNILLMNIYLRD